MMIPPEGRLVRRLVCVAGMYFYYNTRPYCILIFADEKHIHKARMKNQSGEIPFHLRSTWSEVSEELRAASVELHDARTRHHNAVLARIALQETITDHQSSPEWNTLTKEYEEAHGALYQAHVRYNKAVIARVQLSRAINTW